MQAGTKAFMSCGHAKKEVGVGRGRTGGTVSCSGEGGLGTEGCVFAWCLSEETSGVSSITQIKFGQMIKSTSHFLSKCQHE